jgi:RNA polymerase sigma-70 factor (ECF subfamily)
VTPASDAEALYALYHRRLFLYLCRAVGQVETARDLAQDVFVRVTRSPVPEGSEHAVRAWLFRIARNLAIDHGRAVRRHTESALAADDSAIPPRTASQDVSAAVNQALDSLDPLDRDVFLLREVGGLNWEEIGRACDLSPDAVRSRIHRTRLELKDRLAAPIATRLELPIRRSPVGSE